MSLGDDGYGEDDRHHVTRTRLPEGEVDPYAPAARRGRPSGRNLMTVVGVVVLLIAAIAFANRGGGDSTSDSSDDASGHGGKGVSTGPTAPSGTKPVEGKTGGIASGFAHSEQGAQSAAANFAVALGGDGMFKAESRHAIVDSVYAADAAARLKAPQDQAYSADFLKKLGLDASGNPPKDKTFISRTIPVGTKVEAYASESAKVSVWYTGLIGMAGTGSTDPVRTTWKTWTFDMKWVDGDWKVVADDQKDGPAPVSGDVPASSSDDITNAVKEYGGFTYAR
ncbi:membrane protein [Streptomyces sp. NRRL B-1568]|nr:membrane protein [Streptomyces sp. NRRL B-1568]